MANITITRGNTLPDSSAKADFHNLIDQASAAITGIVNADIDGSAAIAGTKISPNFGAQTLTVNGVGITKFSTDGTMDDNSDAYLPTEKAVKTYVDNRKISSYFKTVTAAATDTAHIPEDGSIPQVTEGSQAIESVEITPSKIGNVFKIDVTVSLGVSTAATVAVPLFVYHDSAWVASAIKTSEEYLEDSSVLATVCYSHYFTVTSLTAHKFQVRFGAVGATSHINRIGNGATQPYGTSGNTTIIVTEVAQ